MNNDTDQKQAEAGRRGFTMIELLVCISTLAILVALSLPFVKNSLAAGKQAKCVQNLKVLSSATMMFAADNGGRLPYGGWFEGGNLLTDGDPRIWYNSLESYMDKDRRVFACPAGKDHKAETWLRFTDGESFPSHYGYNICLNWPDQPQQIRMAASTQRPVNIPMIIDVNYHAFMPSWDFDGQGPNKDAGTALATRHQNKGNVAWLDGHVTSEKFEEFYGYARKVGGGEKFLSGNY